MYFIASSLVGWWPIRRTGGGEIDRRTRAPRRRVDDVREALHGAPRRAAHARADVGTSARGCPISPPHRDPDFRKRALAYAWFALEYAENRTPPRARVGRPRSELDQRPWVLPGRPTTLLARGSIER